MDINHPAMVGPIQIILFNIFALLYSIVCFFSFESIRIVLPRIEKQKKKNDMEMNCQGDAVRPLCLWARPACMRHFTYIAY